MEVKEIMDPVEEQHISDQRIRMISALDYNTSNSNSNNVKKKIANNIGSIETGIRKVGEDNTTQNNSRSDG